MEVRGIQGLNAHLALAGAQQRTVFSRHVVIGNQSADLDSVVSALAYAYCLHSQGSRSGVPILPCINTESQYLHLRPEVVYWLEETGVDVHNLIFLEAAGLENSAAKGLLRTTLVDHSVLAPTQEFMRESVVEIIDHHRDEQPFPNLEHRLVEPVGSTATLVAERILETTPEILDDELAKFLLGPILLDTVNLDRSTGRCREKDIVVAMQLLAINPLQRDEVFLELVAKKADLAGLQPEDFFIKDLKTYVINDLRLGISVVPIRLEQWCKENPDLWSMIQTFRKSLRLDLYLIMTYAHTPRFKREIIGHGADRKVLTRLFSCCLVPFLGLTPMKNATLPLNYRDYFLCYDQKMVEISRKKLVPELNHCLQTVKKNRP